MVAAQDAAERSMQGEEVVLWGNAMQDGEGMAAEGVAAEGVAAALLDLDAPRHATRLEARARDVDMEDGVEGGTDTCKRD